MRVLTATSRFAAVRPVTLPTAPDRLPVILAVSPVGMLVAALLPAMNTPPVAPAVALGKKSVLAFTAATSAAVARPTCSSVVTSGANFAAVKASVAIAAAVNTPVAIETTLARPKGSIM